VYRIAYGNGGRPPPNGPLQTIKTPAFAFEAPALCLLAKRPRTAQLLAKIT